MFDLTSLQREANRLYGYTAKQTLDYTQSLYEKKLCTYPRTDSQYLTDDMLPTAENLISGLFDVLTFAKGIDFPPDIPRILNSKKVSDHHAIIPTAEAIKTAPAALPESERNILFLIAAKLLMAVAQPFEYETVTASFSCGGMTFAAKGKTVKKEGYKELERRFRSTLKEQTEDKKNKDVYLPELSEGQTFPAMTAKLSEHDSTPPKPYTEDTLLSAMERAGNEDITEEAERKGLGTPATRAAEVMGLEIAIADELLAEALQTLPQDRLEIVLLSYFLGMSDPEIADQLNLVRRTVAYRRTSSLQALKKFMEGQADE